MTRAVNQAIQERLERVRQERKADALARELLAIGRRCAGSLKKPVVDHATLLYDQRGLPKPKTAQ